MPHAQPPTRSRWRQALHDWAMHRLRPSSSHRLRQRTIYVLPSAAGGVLALTLLVLLVASINFQLNLGYALTFLIAGSALASLWMGHRNLRGIELRLDSPSPIFQGQRAAIPVLLHSVHGQRPRHGISVCLDRHHGPLAWAHTDVMPPQTARIELGWVPAQRGWHAVPDVLIESRFPLGVFRLWSCWRSQARILVYPAPESPTPPVRWGDDAADSTPSPAHTGSTELDGVRGYQRGDALRHVVWKKTATAMASGSGDLVVRDRMAAQPQALWLEARATGLADLEAQIARLTAWVLAAHEQQWIWGLTLPSGLRVAPSNGAQHLQRCLAALAVDGLPQPSSVDIPRTNSL